VTSLSIALLGVLLVPLFVATWRTSLLGLACQGLLMAWMARRLGADPRTLDGIVTLADLGLVRGVVAPLVLHRVLRAQSRPARNDVIPPNLLSWTLALGVVLVSLNFAATLVPEYGEPRTLVAVATSALLLGFLVLSSQAGTFSQIVGALRVENAIALFELGDAPTHSLVGVKVGQSLVVLATILLYRWYLANLGNAPRGDPPTALEGPTI
jgi:hydrogenase-4 membrane subunit HyfE